MITGHPNKLEEASPDVNKPCHTVHGTLTEVTKAKCGYF